MEHLSDFIDWFDLLPQAIALPNHLRLATGRLKPLSATPVTATARPDQQSVGNRLNGKMAEKQEYIREKKNLLTYYTRARAYARIHTHARVRETGGAMRQWVSWFLSGTFALKTAVGTVTKLGRVCFSPNFI